jgi:hypothetical protein
MQRGISIRWPWVGIAVLAVAATVSCGTGIRDGQGDLYVTKTIGPEGGQLVFREATLIVWPNDLSAPASITMRRFPTIDHAGAVGPVFEIQIPTPTTFIGDPDIQIVASDVPTPNPASTIGFLVPGIANEQWVPVTSQPFLSCSSPTVCGPVQSGGFNHPGGTGSGLSPTAKLDLAIITQCASNADCAGRQTCSSTACQQCVEISNCNPP